MKKFIRPLVSIAIIVAVFASLVLAQVISSKNSAHNNVPDYYYANYEFASDYDAILDWFSKAKAKYSVNQEFDTSEFVKLSKYFDKTFPHLRSEFAETYERCSYLAHSLAENYSYSNMQALM